jgi:hypothetical protein
VSDHEIWRTEPDGERSAMLRNLRLIVRSSRDCARYMILRRATDNGECPEVLLESGTESNLNAAMVAARRAATRIEGMLADRRAHYAAAMGHESPAQARRHAVGDCGNAGESMSVFGSFGVAQRPP